MSEATKTSDLVKVTVAYVVALFVGGSSLPVCASAYGHLLNILLADLVATLVIFAFSRSYGNSSFL